MNFRHGTFKIEKVVRLTWDLASDSGDMVPIVNMVLDVVTLLKTVLL